MTTLVFIVRRLLGESGISLFESLMVSTLRSLKLMISSTSAVNVLRSSPILPKEFLQIEFDVTRPLPYEMHQVGFCAIEFNMLHFLVRSY